MSIYNKKYGVVFIHVPKTAGTSMERAPFAGGGGHKTALMIREEVSNEVWSKAFKFAFVRDPLERFASCYYHLMPQHKGKSFAEFVREAARWPPGYNRFTNHFSQQSFFLCDDDGNVMVDFVGRFHALKQDWTAVCEKIGVHFDLLHLRKGSHPPYEECYTSELKVVVQKVYQRDYDLLGHHFPSV